MGVESRSLSLNPQSLSPLLCDLELWMGQEPKRKQVNLVSLHRKQWPIKDLNTRDGNMAGRIPEGTQSKLKDESNIILLKRKRRFNFECLPCGRLWAKCFFYIILVFCFNHH